MEARAQGNRKRTEASQPCENKNPYDVMLSWLDVSARTAELCKPLLLSCNKITYILQLNDKHYLFTSYIVGK